MDVKGKEGGMRRNEGEKDGEEGEREWNSYSRP